MKYKRIILPAVVGFATLVGGVWLLHQTLGNNRATWYRGQTLEYWVAQVNARDNVVSNQANVVLNTEIIPWLTDKMFHDTNDSRLRLTLVDGMSKLDLFDTPVLFAPAVARRREAAFEFGNFGPAAKAAIPALLQAVQSSDAAVHENAILSLGAIHGEPEVVIPLLVKSLDNDQLNDAAATALGNFGSLAQPATPKLMLMVHAADKEERAVAAKALQQIDAKAYADAMKQPGQ